MSPPIFYPGTRMATDEEMRTFVRIQGERVVYHTTYTRHAVPIYEWVAWCETARVMFRGGPAPQITDRQRKLGLVAFDALAQEAEHDDGRAWWVRQKSGGWAVTLELTNGDSLSLHWPVEPYYRDVCAWFAGVSAAETVVAALFAVMEG